MKANELRIGNWVLVPYPAPILIPCHARQIDGAEYYGTQLVFGTDPTKHPLTWNLKHCAGIPLDEEWLLKFGFERKNRWFGKGDFSYEDNKIYLGFGCHCEGPEETDIKYVHQLQNLYFTLTGEELVCQP
jgi:hypothetical protein